MNKICSFGQTLTSRVICVYQSIYHLICILVLTSRPETRPPSHKRSQLSQSFASSQSGLENMQPRLRDRQYLIENQFILDDIACLSYQQLIIGDQLIITAATFMMHS